MTLCGLFDSSRGSMRLHVRKDVKGMNNDVFWCRFIVAGSYVIDG